MEIGAGLLAFALAPGLAGSADSLDMVAFYTRLAFPSVICITLASIGAALLNIRGRFGAASLAPLAVNGGLIAAILLMETGFDPPLKDKAALLAAAASVAGAVQLLIVGWAVRRADTTALRFRRPVWSPQLKGLLLAGFPGSDRQRRGAAFRARRHASSVVLAVGRVVALLRRPGRATAVGPDGGFGEQRVVAGTRLPLPCR